MVTQTIGSSSFRGHKIDKVRTPFNQEFFVVDGDKGTAYWSLTDACRALKGEAVKYEPVDIVGI